MQRALDWIKRRGDQNSVTYSRFGLPGEEQDDRPAPSVIHVAPFEDDAKEYLIFNVHSQRAAITVAGIGMGFTFFLFLSAFFEFDWYHHEKGIDVGAFLGLLLFLGLGMSIHWYVVRGIKLGKGLLLVPFIIVYSMLLVFEFISFIVLINHWIAIKELSAATQEPAAFFGSCLFLIIMMLIQYTMLFSVVRCRNFLEKKAIHDLEVSIAERSKNMYPGIRIVYGNGVPCPTTTISVVSESVDGMNGTANQSPPPSYNNAQQAAAPQRTILQAEDGIN